MNTRKFGICAARTKVRFLLSANDMQIGVRAPQCICQEHLDDSQRAPCIAYMAQYSILDYLNSQRQKLAALIMGKKCFQTIREYIYTNAYKPLFFFCSVARSPVPPASSLFLSDSILLTN